MTMTTMKMQLAACHVRKFRWNPPLSFPPPTPYRHRRCAKLYNIYIYPSIYRFSSSLNPFLGHISYLIQEPYKSSTNPLHRSRPVSLWSHPSPTPEAMQKVSQQKKIKHQPVLKSTQKHTHMPDLPKKSSNCFGKNPHRSAGSSWGSCDLCRVAGARSTGHWGTERSKEPRAAGTRRSTGGVPLVRICLGKYGGKVDINWYMGKCLYK